ncbi:MAG: hypothetical protein ABW026_15930 [Microvirga sp.]
MSVRLAGDAVILAGACGVEDAEPLLALLQDAPTRIVDIAQVESLHTAVFQVLLATRPPLRGRSPNPFVRDWLMPILSQG